MTRCEKFYDKMKQLLNENNPEKLKEFCNKNQDTLNKIEQHLEFVEKINKVITESGNTLVLKPSVVPERATREIRSQPEKIQEKVIPKIIESVKKEEKVTTPQVKEWVNQEYKDQDIKRKEEIKEISKEVESEDVEECESGVCSVTEISLEEEFCPKCPAYLLQEDGTFCSIEGMIKCPVWAFIKYLEESGKKIV